MRYPGLGFFHFCERGWQFFFVSVGFGIKIFMVRRAKIALSGRCSLSIQTDESNQLWNTCPIATLYFTDEKILA